MNDEFSKILNEFPNVLHDDAKTPSGMKSERNIQSVKKEFGSLPDSLEATHWISGVQLPKRIGHEGKIGQEEQCVFLKTLLKSYGDYVECTKISGSNDEYSLKFTKKEVFLVLELQEIINAFEKINVAEVDLTNCVNLQGRIDLSSIHSLRKCECDIRKNPNLNIDISTKCPLYKTISEVNTIDALKKKYRKDISVTEQDGQVKITFKNKNMSDEQINQILSDCSNINVVRLHMDNCKNFSSWSCLKKVPNLQRLYLSGCTSLHCEIDLSYMSHLDTIGVENIPGDVTIIINSQCKFATTDQAKQVPFKIK